MTPSQTAQISSPAPPPGSRPSTTGGLGARSRSRSTSAAQAAELAFPAGPFGSSPPGTMKFAAMPMATTGTSMRGGGGIPGELMMRPIGEGTISMDEDSPTDSHYRAMPYGRTVREVPEDISEDGEWEGDFDSKRSRASTLSSPASVSGVLGGSFAGLRRKISDSKRIMKPLSPESTHADLKILKNQQRAITPSSGFRSPPSGQTSDDDDMDDDSVISGFSRSLVQGGMPYNQSRPPTRRQPPPLELTPTTATLTVRSRKIMTMNSSTSSSSLHMQSRSQSVPPKQLMEIGPSPVSLDNAKLATSGGPVVRNLEIPSDICGSTALQAARLSSVNQAPSSGQLTQQNRSISTTAMSSIARSDSGSSSGTNNTNSIVSVTTNHGNVGQPSSTVATQQSQVSQQGQLQHKYLTAQDRKSSSKVSLAASARLQKSQTPEIRNPNSVPMPRSSQPPFPDPSTAPKVAPAPASGMYWYKAPEHGQQRLALRAHTCTMVGSSIYVFGGCDRACYNDMHVFDTDSMSWSKPTVYGEIPPPLRAMTTTAVGKKLVIFGGGDGPTYYNDVYIFDTTTNRYTKPAITGEQPSKRRAHTACFYRNGIYIFGGGDGERALDDVWRLDVSDFNKLFWKCVCPPSSGSGSVTSRVPANTSTTSLSAKIRKNGPMASNSPTLDGSPLQQQRPTARGYHTANMVGSKLIVYGGSDGQECFRDVWVFDVDTEVWKLVPMDPPPPPPTVGTTPPLASAGGGKVSFQRLSHTATIVGSYLFVVGGHDGVEYSSEVLLLNLGRYSQKAQCYSTNVRQLQCNGTSGRYMDSHQQGEATMGQCCMIPEFLSLVVSMGMSQSLTTDGAVAKISGVDNRYLRIPTSWNWRSAVTSARSAILALRFKYDDWI